MPGVIATLPKFQFSNALGLPMSGGTLTSYLAGTTTPVTTYQDEALTSANTNPITLDSRGECLIWLDSTKVYKFVLKNAAGVTQWTVDNITNSSALAASLDAQLRADLADSSGASLIGFKQSGTGAVDMTVQDALEDFVTVSQFGAVGDGVADDTAAIQAAINVLSVGGGAVFFPPGVYKVSSGINVLDGVSLLGAGSYASVISTSNATADVITLGNSASVKDLKIISSVTRTNGTHVNIQTNGAIVDNCEFEGYYVGVTVGTVGGAQALGALITDCEFRFPAVSAGSGAIQMMNFSNFIIRSCVGAGPAYPAVQPDFGIRIRNGDTGFISGTNFTLHGKALYVDPQASSNCYALTIDGSLFDSAGTITGGSAVSSAEINPAGGVWNTKISNTWFGLSRGAMGCYMGTSGSGTVDGITFTGCEFTSNHDCGLIVVGTGVKNWMVTGGHSGGNTNSGIRVAGASSQFSINSHKAGNIAGRGANTVGITVDAGASNNYIIEGCNVTGNASAGIFDAGTGTSATVANNLGYNGAQPAAGLTVGASPWTYTAGHTPEALYFAGGVVSDIKIDAVTVQNTTSSTIQLAPNQVMQVTYSSLPTIIRKMY